MVDVSGGEVHYVDQKEGTDFRHNQIDFKVKDFDLNRPFSAELAAALFSEKQNFSSRPRLDPSAHTTDFNDVPLDGKADIESLDFGKLKSTLPAVRAALPKDMDLSGILTAKDLRLKGTLKKLSLERSFRRNWRRGDLWPDSAQGCRNPIGGYSRRPIRKWFASLGPNESETEYYGADRQRRGKPRRWCAVLNLSLASNRFSLDGWEKIIPPLNDYQLSGNLEVQKTTVQGKLGKGAMPRIQGSITLSGVNAKPPQFPKPIKDLRYQD